MQESIYGAPFPAGLPTKIGKKAEPFHISKGSEESIIVCETIPSSQLTVKIFPLKNSIQCKNCPYVVELRRFVGGGHLTS